MPSVGAAGDERPERLLLLKTVFMRFIYFEMPGSDGRSAMAGSEWATEVQSLVEPVDETEGRPVPWDWMDGKGVVCVSLIIDFLGSGFARETREGG
jgi:hypothetical protein